MIYGSLKKNITFTGGSDKIHKIVSSPDDVHLYQLLKKRIPYVERYIGLKDIYAVN